MLRCSRCPAQGSQMYWLLDAADRARCPALLETWDNCSSQLLGRVGNPMDLFHVRTRPPTASLRGLAFHLPAPRSSAALPPPLPLPPPLALTRSPSSPRPTAGGGPRTLRGGEGAIMAKILRISTCRDGDKGWKAMDLSLDKWTAVSP